MPPRPCIALLGSSHIDESYYVGYNINGFEVGLNPAGEGGGPVAFADVEDLDAARETVLAGGATERDAPGQVPPARVSACSPTRTAIRSACAESSRHVAVPPPHRSKRAMAARFIDPPTS